MAEKFGLSSRIADIAAMTLESGSYVLGASIFSEFPVAALDATLETIAEVSGVRGVTSGIFGPGLNSGFQRPDEPFLLTNAIVGPNLRLAAVSVPASATVWLLLLAGMLLRITSRRKT